MTVEMGQALQVKEFRFYSKCRRTPLESLSGDVV